MDDNERLAQALYPDIDKTPEYYEELYPPRSLPDGARVTRFAPSPTGYMHIGNLFSALIDWLAAGRNGVFYLRIEDTDKKREVPDAVEKILSGLSEYGITPTEGVVGPGEEKGSYGPYVQSSRRAIYECAAKDLVRRGLAYPCFCTEDELTDMRARQEAAGVTPGYWGEWAKCRDLSADECIEKIKAGLPYVIRLRSARSDKRIVVDDMIKGKLEMPANNVDAVLMKADGIPPYAFAHAVDDHFMRTTHVIRGDEWIASLPLHIEIFGALGFRPPKYAHISPIMKTDGGNKRKLSKRKDPEAAVSYYASQGVCRGAVLEYLMTLANSDFEDWRRANCDAPLADFKFSFKKMSASGALFDLDKLDDIGKNVISRMSAQEVYEALTRWAEEYDTELYGMIAADPAYTVSVFSIDRGGKKPRKDMADWKGARAFLMPFFDELFESSRRLPENVSRADAQAVIAAYAPVWDPADDGGAWFDKVKSICPALGYCPDVKKYRADPGAYKGHVGDVSAVIRLAVTGRDTSPDLCSIMKLLGPQRVAARLAQYARSAGTDSAQL